MYRLVRALHMAALAVALFGLDSAITASDPVPSADSPFARTATAVREVARRTRPGIAVPFTATAYCQHGTTRSGVNTHAGIAAADPATLPVGSVVHVETRLRKYDGVYTVLDTGSKVQGNHVDLFMHNCREAEHFGRQRAKVTVLRKGWSPRGSALK